LKHNRSTAKASTMPANRNTEKKWTEQAVDWFLRLQDNRDDAELEAKFQAWLAHDAAAALAYQRVQRLMGDASRMLSSDLDFTRKAAKRSLPRPRDLIATVALLLLCSGGFLLADGPMRLRADVISGVGQPRTITLSDGSTVELNASSAIAINLEGSQRRITLLRGEAYFQVAADPKRPFVVTAGNGTTTALGTAFDINLTENATCVIVTEHAVMVGPEHSEQKQRLNERQQLAYDGEGRVGDVEAADPDMALAWRQGRLAFEDRPLASVVEDIARYIPGKIIIAQTALADRRISGSLNLAAPEETLSSFANAFQINVTRVGPYLTVLSR
jgi:transmembrane sensor